ncbi:PREDICTED: uncharacterized protein LOC104786007 [Camelina sativa]|uniref:Uncharacterized protein LOC104786007 n=1 Tax=Camelina sativa TaxID=90675 RepID=A0ABM0Z2S2_CAMSA|nr:PREDICTED: uncharacterized protein LOC104786007 [Camelina sativa]
MQRLSLESSASKLHHHSYGGRKDDAYDIDDLKPVSSSTPSSSSSAAADYDDHELKKELKPRRLSSLQSPFAVTTNQKREKLVHFIPILTLLCFIILYLTSHPPSQSDLAQFNGFMRTSKHLEESGDDEISGYVRGDTLAIRTSVRNLQETESFPTKSLPRRRTSHRKTADF